MTLGQRGEQLNAQASSWLEDLRKRFNSELLFSDWRNWENRSKIERDMVSLRELLKKTYKRGNSKSIRNRTGEVLGYSHLRIWSHEHPITVAVGGIIAGMGAAYGLAHIYSQYLSK